MDYDRTHQSHLESKYKAQEWNKTFLRKIKCQSNSTIANVCPSVCPSKLAEKLKSHEMKDDEGWWRMMKVDEGWWRMMKDDEGWWRRMKDNDFKLLGGFWWTDGQTKRRTDICDCRVAFMTENCWGGSKGKKQTAKVSKNSCLEWL